MIEVYELAGVNPEHRFSPYCWRIRFALAHKGLDARFIPWHFQDKKLPGGADKVPVLVDDGEVVAGSTDIALYLEDVYETGPSLFGGPSGEAHARFIIAWTDSVVHPAFFPLVAPDLLRFVRPAAQKYFRETREKRLGTTFEKAAGERDAKRPAARAVLTPLRVALENQDFLGGEEPSYADYAAFSPFQWARLTTDYQILADDDPLHPWLVRMLELFDGLAAEAEPPF